MDCINKPIATIDNYEIRLTAYSDSSLKKSKTVRGADIQLISSRPLLSVVTVCRNSASTIERTIRSVIAQEYEHVEYIVIDGGSTDGTVDIIRRYASSISYWHTGPDKGISDAFNLGISACHGKYVALVNADDWMSVDQGAAAVAALEAHENAAFVFGRLKYYNPDGRLSCSMGGDPSYYEKIRYGMPQINHVSVVVRRTAYAKVGLFDPRWRIAMDYDWHLRAELRGLRGVYTSALEANMTEGGVCFRDWKGGLREVRDCAIGLGQERWPVQAHYCWRLARGIVRERVRRILPARLLRAAHKLMNPHYRAA